MRSARPTHLVNGPGGGVHGGELVADMAPEQVIAIHTASPASTSRLSPDRGFPPTRRPMERKARPHREGREREQPQNVRARSRWATSTTCGYRSRAEAVPADHESALQHWPATYGQASEPAGGTPHTNVGDVVSSISTRSSTVGTSSRIGPHVRAATPRLIAGAFSPIRGRVRQLPDVRRAAAYKRAAFVHVKAAAARPDRANGNRITIEMHFLPDVRAVRRLQRPALQP